MRKKRSKRSNKTNSAASSPRSSAFSVTPFEEQNVPPSSSAMTTPKKSGKKRYESSEYSDYLMTTKSASKRATKFSYNTKMKKSGKRRKSGKCASFVCNAMDSSNPSFLKTPDKVEVPRNPEAKDERGSKADMNFATPISFSHPPTEEQLVQGDSWDQREKMHLTKSLKKENGDPVSAIQFSTYDTSKDAYSSKVIPKRSSNTNSRKSKSIKSMVTSQASENIGVDVDIEIIDDSDFQNSSEDSLYDPNKERAQDFTEMWTQNVKDEDQRKLLNKTMRTIAEVSDENISSKDHSNLIKSKNSKPSFHLNSVNLSQSQLDINKPYPYTRKVKLIQHCQKAHDEQFSSQNSYSKYSSGLSQEKRIFSGFKEFTDNIRSSNQESICDTEERYCETNEDYNPLNDTGNLTMTERGPIMLSRETDKHIPREIDLTNSNEHFLGSSCTEGVSSPSQAMPVVILRAESE